MRVFRVPAFPVVAVQDPSPLRLIELESGVLIDAQPQYMDHCDAADKNAWQRALRFCEERKMVLCSFDEYMEAYSRELRLIPPPAYAFTRTIEGCGLNRHVIIAWGAPYIDEHDGCHTNAGCWPDRYIRCCRHYSEYLLENTGQEELNASRGHRTVKCTDLEKKKTDMIKRVSPSLSLHENKYLALLRLTLTGIALPTRPEETSSNHRIRGSESAPLNSFTMVGTYVADE